MSTRLYGEIRHTLFGECKLFIMNSMPTPEYWTPQRIGQSHGVFPAHGATSVSALRVALSLLLLVLVLLLIGYLADWSQLKLAVRQLGGQPWLLAILIVAYTGAFLLRAVAWRVLSSGCIGIYQLFVSIQSEFLVKHLTPIKLGEIVRPRLATRYGMPVAEASSTTAVARYLDFAALLAIASVVGTAVSLKTGSRLWLEGLTLPAAVILGYGTILLATRQSRGFGVPPGLLRTRLELLRDQLRQVSARQVAFAAVWTAPSWVLEAAVILVAAKALGIELSIAIAVAVTAFTILFQVFHITQGVIGVYEAVITGAPSRTHGMRSNFVPSLGVKCESIFDSLRESGMTGKLVGIAHLVDAFGDDVEMVTAVTRNDEIDDALVARAKAVMERDNPDAQAGNRDALGTHQVEALAFYRSIQPDVGKADSSADETIMAYLTGEPRAITVALRDGALAALNGVAPVLLLERSDLVTRYTDDTGDGSSGVPSPDTGDLDLSSSIFIPLRQAMDRARQSDDDMDAEALETATHEVFSRFNAMFYLATVRYPAGRGGRQGPRNPPGRSPGVLPVHPARGHSSQRRCGRDHHGLSNCLTERDYDRVPRCGPGGPERGCAALLLTQDDLETSC